MANTIDDLIKHRIFLQRLGVGNAKALREIVVAAVEPLRIKLKEGTLTYNQIQKEITRIRASLKGNLYNAAVSDLKDFILYETGFNLKVLEKNSTSLESLQSPTKADLMDELENKTVNTNVGNAVKLTTLYTLLEKNIIDDVKKSVFSVDTMAVTKESRTQMLEEIETAINTKVTNKLTAVAVTSVNHVAEVSMATIVAANLDIFDYVQWDTVLDSDVCEDCEALEGQVWTAGEEDETPPLHINCRCILTPFSSTEEL